MIDELLTTKPNLYTRVCLSINHDLAQIQKLLEVQTILQTQHISPAAVAAFIPEESNRAFRTALRRFSLPGQWFRIRADVYNGCGEVVKKLWWGSCSDTDDDDDKIVNVFSNSDSGLPRHPANCPEYRTCTTTTHTVWILFLYSLNTIWIQFENYLNTARKIALIPPAMLFEFYIPVYNSREYATGHC